MRHSCVYLAILFSFACRASAIARNLLEKNRFHEDTGTKRCGPMFVAVLTTPDKVNRRENIRSMWQDASAGWGRIKAKFAMCLPGGQNNMSLDLQVEQSRSKDLMVMDCEEGYLKGALTRKVRHAMEHYLEGFSKEYDFFMKIDDDTFISPRRLCDLFVWRRETAGLNNLAAYFGVFAEGPHEEVFTQHRVDRDPESSWYEPVETFADDVYPASAKGGPGYILSRELVEPIIDLNIARDNELHNEDKAVGVWVDLLKKTGKQVAIVNVPGTDGYESHAESIITAGTYKDYPYAVHHHLTGETIKCLHKVDTLPEGEARQKGSITECFELMGLAPVTAADAKIAFEKAAAENKAREAAAQK